MRRLAIIMIAALGLTALAATAAQSVGSKAGALVELALKGFGGADSVSATSSLVAHGNAEKPSGAPAAYSFYVTNAGDFRLDLVSGSRSITRTRSSAGSYFSSGGGRLEKVEVDDDWRLVFEQKSLGLVFELLRPELRPEYSGMGFIEGKRYEKLVLYDPAAPALLVVLDGKTGQVKRTFMDTGQGPGGVFEMRFSDYSQEGELVLPHSFDEYVGGRQVLRVKLDEVLFNNDVSPHLFRP